MMSNLISRQAAIMHFVKVSKNYECEMFDLREVTHELWQLPSAEPEIIRCMECKHRHEAECPMYHEEDIEWDDDGYIERDTIYHDWTEDDGYCDRGEMRTDEDD